MQYFSHRARCSLATDDMWLLKRAVQLQRLLSTPHFTKQWGFPDTDKDGDDSLLKEALAVSQELVHSPNNLTGEELHYIHFADEKLRPVKVV